MESARSLCLMGLLLLAMVSHARAEPITLSVSGTVEQVDVVNLARLFSWISDKAEGVVVLDNG